MKTTIFYFGLFVSLLGNISATHANTKVVVDANRTFTFENGTRLSKPELVNDLDGAFLSELSQIIVSPEKASFEEEVNEGYKIIDAQPQVYQLLTVQPTIKDTIRFNEAVIDSEL